MSRKELFKYYAGIYPDDLIEPSFDRSGVIIVIGTLILTALMGVMFA